VAFVRIGNLAELLGGRDRATRAWDDDLRSESTGCWVKGRLSSRGTALFLSRLALRG